MPSLLAKGFLQLWQVKWSLLFVAALTSAISLHEVATAYVTEEFGLSRRKGAAIVTLTVLVFGTLCSLSFGPLSGVTL